MDLLTFLCKQKSETVSQTFHRFETNFVQQITSTNIYISEFKHFLCKKKSSKYFTVKHFTDLKQILSDLRMSRKILKQ